ncbi:hypothetical protein AGLY_014227 [Aphis glycines]|uniref:FAR1 domain-containing protein n=1 Tax=Aphis glycines TaxID=307491 RepID=A0A6G0T3U4_APHGL|nr:hypothetical protein AGLY_014227 [Aphis glycines]
MFGLIEIKPGTFRGNLVNEVDINEYIKSYSLKTNTSWCVVSSKMSTRFVCRSFHKKTPKENNKGKSKNSDCRAKIEILIKLSTKDTNKKRSVISIQNDHNHTVVSGEALSYLRPTIDVNIQFEAIHEENIELKHGINSTELTNAHINPKYRTVRYWYDEWKKLYLGPHSGIGVNKNMIFQYEINKAQNN